MYGLVEMSGLSLCSGERLGPHKTLDKTGVLWYNIDMENIIEKILDNVDGCALILISFAVSFVLVSLGIFLIISAFQVSGVL